MIATLIRREFLEHVTSLRLSVLLIMTTGLLVTSAAYFSARYDSATNQSPFVRPGASQGLVDKDGKTNLMMAPCTGFGLHRALSPLGFLAGAGEREFPDLVMVAPHGLKSIQRETKTGEAFEPAEPADWAESVAGATASAMQARAVNGLVGGMVSAYYSSPQGDAAGRRRANRGAVFAGSPRPGGRDRSRE